MAADYRPVPDQLRMSLLDVARLMERTLVYEMRRREREGDDEGARLNSLTLVLVRNAIAEAEAEARG